MTPLPGRLPARAAFVLQASIVVSFLAGSSAPTPLYAVYQSQWHFSAITTTVVFGIYALAVLAALLVVGSLSDHVGRRPVLLAAIAAQAVTMVLFARAAGVPELLVARVVQGLSTGAAVGAVGAGMLDLDRVKGTIANAVAPLTGTATGALVSGLLVQYLPHRTTLVYVVLLAVFALQALGVLLMAETSSRHPGALHSLRVQVGLPPQTRRPFLLAVPAIVAVWVLGGLYGSIAPALTRYLVGSTSYVLGGLALSVLAAAGGISVLATRTWTPRSAMFVGTLGLIVGVGLTLVATAVPSATLFFLGTAVAGSGFGAGFQGAIRSVLPLAAPHERAGVLSLLWVVSYLAMGLPAVVGGWLVVHGGGLVATSREYGAAVIVLSLLALLGLVRSRPELPPHHAVPAPQATPDLVKAEV